MQIGNYNNGGRVVGNKAHGISNGHTSCDRIHLDVVFLIGKLHGDFSLWKTDASCAFQA